MDLNGDAWAKWPLAAALLGARSFAAAAQLMVEPYLALRFVGVLGLRPLHAIALASVVLVAGRLLAKPLGALADRWRGATLGWVALVAGAASTLLLTRIEGPSGLVLGLVSCVGMSVAGALFMLVLRTQIARNFASETLPLMYGAASMSFNLGVFGGSALAAALIGAGWAQWVIPVSASLYVLAGALWSIGFPAEGNIAAPVLVPGRVSAPVLSMPIADRQRLRALCLGQGLIGYLATSVVLMLALYCERVLGSVALAGWFYGAQSILLVGALPVLGLIMRSMGVAALARMYFLGVFAAGLGCVGFGLIASPDFAIAFLAFGFCCSQACAIPAADPLLVRSFDPTVLGRAFGATMRAMAVGSVIACLLNALFAEVLGDRLLWLIWSIPGGIALIFTLALGRAATFDPPVPARS